MGCSSNHYRGFIYNSTGNYRKKKCFHNPGNQKLTNKGELALLYHIQDLHHLLLDAVVVLPFVGPQASRAILIAALCIGEFAAALIPQGIQWAIAEQAAESFRIRTLMAGKIFTFPVLKKIVIRHNISSKYENQTTVQG